jgi:membrane fusion protein (multidrug efflux system)
MEQQSRPGRRRTVVVRILVVTVVVAAAAAAGLRAKGVFNPAPALASSAPTEAAGTDAKKDKEPTAVAVAAVEQGAIAAYTAATANLVPEDEVQVVAEAERRVQKLLADEGHRVAAGQALLHIDPTDARIAVDKAALALRNAEITLKRAETMEAEKLISPQDLDNRRYERDNAVHVLQEARQRLRRTTVVAPFAGRVTVRRVQLGQTLKPGDVLFTVADFEPLVARIFLPEREVLGLAPGHEVRLALRADAQARFAGRIQQISPVVDTASGTVKVTVEAVRPPDFVRPGAFVTVEVLREKRERALLVPRTAVVRELSEAYVFVADGKLARKRAVELGLEENGRLEVRSGVKAGEQVVTSGHGALRDQSPITVAPPATASASASTRS